MGKKVRRLMLGQAPYANTTGETLERMAEKGLFLVSMGAVFWKFEKREPKKVHYAVTYFLEGSIFNPEPTENQQTYMAYAQEAGWQFISQSGQMQVFMNEEENPVPFETDPREHFENIKRCMKKSYLPGGVALVAMFSLNIAFFIASMIEDPTDFFATGSLLFAISMLSICVFSYLFTFVDYIFWCRKSEKSIALGGGCAETMPGVRKIMDALLITIIGTSLLLYFYDQMQSGGVAILLLGLLQMPLLIAVYQGAIAFMRKKKQEAAVNKAVSGILLMGSCIVYVVAVTAIVVNFDFSPEENRPHETIQWQTSPTESFEYDLYRDEIPLTCEDLYGVTDYEYYSYEKRVEDTIFLTRTSYGQTSLPAKDAPPEIFYTIIVPKMNFLHPIVAEDQMKESPWFEERKTPLDNDVFSTTQAYQFYRNDLQSGGKYVLIYEDKIVILKFDKALTQGEILVVREKLQLG